MKKQKPSVTEALREELFKTLKGLQEGSISAETAVAVSKISSNIISTVMVEIKAAEWMGAYPADGLNSTGRQIKSGVVHQVEGGVVHRIK